MCVLCYGLAGEEHWTDARVGDEPNVSVRARRRRLLTQLIAAHGLDYSEDPTGVTALVGDRKGNVAVARGLGELWAAAERLAGRPLDPLEPAILGRLDRRSTPA
jgi:hypothetical protein